MCRKINICPHGYAIYTQLKLNYTCWAFTEFVLVNHSPIHSFDPSLLVLDAPSLVLDAPSLILDVLDLALAFHERLFHLYGPPSDPIEANP